jgi:hypothetical protein
MYKTVDWPAPPDVLEAACHPLMKKPSLLEIRWRRYVQPDFSGRWAVVEGQREPEELPTFLLRRVAQPSNLVSKVS